MNIGKGFVQFGEKQFTYADANKEISEYCAFNHKQSYFPTNWWEMLIFVIIGKMASGKSTYSEGINFLLWHLFHDTDAGYEGYHVNDLSFAMNYLNREENITKRKKVLLLNVDDSMSPEASGLNSLRTMASENLEIEELISMWRHKLANENKYYEPDPRVKNGFAVLIFNIQDPKRLSAMVRRLADVIIYKTAYKSLKKEMSVEDWDFLAKISEASSKKIYKARSLSLIETDSKFMKWYIPRVPEEFKEKYPKLQWLIDDGKYDPYENIFEDLKEVYCEDWRFYELESWVYNWCKTKGLNYNPTLNQEIKRRIVYWQKFEREEQKEEEKSETTTSKIDCAKVHEMRKKGLSFRKIGLILEINSGLVYQVYEKWCLDNDIEMINSLNDIRVQQHPDDNTITA